MTVQEFYDWCKERKFTDAELAINLKSIGCDGENVAVIEHNINYFESKKPEKRKFVTLGGDKHGKENIYYCPICRRRL